MSILSVFGLPAKVKSAAPNATHAEAQFETQILTLHNLAADIADCASAANYVAEGGSIATLAACRKVFPAPHDATHRRGDIEMRSCDPDYWIAVLRHQIGHTMHITELAALPGSRDVAALVDCARRWRELGWLAMAAIDAMEPEARWRIAGRYSENAVVLDRAFRAISQGHWPCVSTTGVVTRLTLPQRRRIPRFEIKQRCRIICGHRIIEAKALDVSVGGMGIATSVNFDLKAEVVVELENGRLLTGYVAWTKQGRLGIQFTDELGTDDPLVCN